jgi:3-hydroxyacyl-CoA dehydrogenase
MSEHVITQVAIIGAGTMGAKIAHRCAVSNLVVN